MQKHKSLAAMTATRFRNRRNPVLILILFLLSSCATAPCMIAQAGPDSAYQAKRQKAAELFKQDKRLEALPLLEELVQTNPKDDAMLVALAACLIDHAATLTDQEAAGRERFRARDLLDKAWNLGNTNPLALNLSQLLKELPESGAIKFSDNPAVQQVMLAGEAAFSRRDFDEALKDYFKALQLDPGNYSAVLFIGNAYDKQNQFAKAAEWYQRAIGLDPNVETAYRYYADLLARQGDMKKARGMLIDAAVAEPYNRMVWRELHAWATINNTKINLLYVGIPVPQKEEKPGPSSAPSQSQEVARAWKLYHSVKDNWKKKEFNKHFPREAEYRHSLAEEYEALTAVARALEKLKEDKKIASLDDPPSDLLLKLHQAGFMEPYVLFSLGDGGIAKDYVAYRAKNRAKLEDYMDRFVMPPAPASQ
jgi:tetratricopeptide (TPR) repeat protein